MCPCGETADTVVLEATASRRVGSTPTTGTKCRPVAELAYAAVSKAVKLWVRLPPGPPILAG